MLSCRFQDPLMSVPRERSSAGTMSTATVSCRQLLAASGVAAVGGLSGCLNQVVSRATNTRTSPAAVFTGTDESVGEPHVSRVVPSVSVASGPLSGSVELET